jgi:hypothetical protein
MTIKNKASMLLIISLTILTTNFSINVKAENLYTYDLQVYNRINTSEPDKKIEQKKTITYNGDPCVNKSAEDIDVLLYNYNINPVKPSPNFDIKPIKADHVGNVSGDRKIYFERYEYASNFIEESRTLKENVDDLIIAEGLLKGLRNANKAAGRSETRDTNFKVEDYKNAPYYDQIKDTKSSQEAKQALEGKRDKINKDLEENKKKIDLQKDKLEIEKSLITKSKNDNKFGNDVNEKTQGLANWVTNGLNNVAGKEVLKEVQVDFANAKSNYLFLSEQEKSIIIVIDNLKKEKENLEKERKISLDNLDAFEGVSKATTGELIASYAVTDNLMNNTNLIFNNIKGLPMTKTFINNFDKKDGDEKTERVKDYSKISIDNLEDAIRIDRGLLIAKTARGEIQGKEYREEISTAINNECIQRNTGNSMNKIVPFIANFTYVLLIACIVFSFFKLALAFGTGENEKVPKTLRGLIMQVLLLGIALAMFQPVNVRKNSNDCTTYAGYRINEIWSSRMYTSQLNMNKKDTNRPEKPCL